MCIRDRLKAVNRRKKLLDYLKKNKIQNTDWSISQNNKKGFGDYSSNIALVLAKILKKAPIDLANDILEFHKEDNLFSIFVTKPGFVNFTVDNSYYSDVVNQILSDKDSFAKPKAKKQTANVEFVSCNPTGPLTIGHGRQAVLGDIISNILSWHNYDVTREYYYNDAGKQMRVLAQSCYAKYANKIGRKFESPENGYVGEYLDDIVEKIIEKYGDDLDENDEKFRTFTEKEIFKNKKVAIILTGGNVDVKKLPF